MVATRAVERCGCPRHGPSPQFRPFAGDAARGTAGGGARDAPACGHRRLHLRGRGQHLCLRSLGRRRQSRSVTWLSRLPRSSWRWWRRTTGSTLPRCSCGGGGADGGGEAAGGRGGGQGEPVARGAGEGPGQPSLLPLATFSGIEKVDVDKAGNLRKGRKRRRRRRLSCSS